MLDFVLAPSYFLILTILLTLGAHAHVCCYGWPFADALGLFPPTHPLRLKKLEDLYSSRIAGAPKST